MSVDPSTASGGAEDEIVDRLAGLGADGAIPGGKQAMAAYADGDKLQAAGAVGGAALGASVGGSVGAQVGSRLGAVATNKRNRRLMIGTTVGICALPMLLLITAMVVIGGIGGDGGASLYRSTTDARSSQATADDGIPGDVRKRWEDYATASGLPVEIPIATIQAYGAPMTAEGYSAYATDGQGSQASQGGASPSPSASAGATPAAGPSAADRAAAEKAARDDTPIGPYGVIYSKARTAWGDLRLEGRRIAGQNLTFPSPVEWLDESKATPALMAILAATVDRYRLTAVGDATTPDYLDAGVVLVEQPNSSDSGFAVGDDPDSQRAAEAVRTAFVESLAALPTQRAAELAPGIFQTALNWHLGQTNACTPTTGAAGLWANPMIDSDGGSGAAGDFGPRINPATGRASFHTGVDLSNVSGTKIYAAGSGTVHIITDRSWPLIYGSYFVSIDHGNGIETRYGHMRDTGADRIVKDGDVVSAGQQIGVQGAVSPGGYATGEHLHFEVLVNGEYVEPYAFFAERGIKLGVDDPTATVGDPTAGGGAGGAAGAGAGGAGSGAGVGEPSPPLPGLVRIATVDVSGAADDKDALSSLRSAAARADVVFGQGLGKLELAKSFDVGWSANQSTSRADERDVGVLVSSRFGSIRRAGLTLLSSAATVGAKRTPNRYIGWADVTTAAGQAIRVASVRYPGSRFTRAQRQADTTLRRFVSNSTGAPLALGGAFAQTSAAVKALARSAKATAITVGGGSAILTGSGYTANGFDPIDSRGTVGGLVTYQLTANADPSGASGGQGGVAGAAGAPLPTSLTVHNASGQPLTLNLKQLQNAAEVVQGAYDKGLGDPAALIGLQVNLAESKFINYANSNNTPLPGRPGYFYDTDQDSDGSNPWPGDVSRSLSLPHEGVGSDFDSVGLFQQRYFWGSIEDRMNPRKSAGFFYDALVKVPGWETMPRHLAAQRVQRSAFSDGSNYLAWEQAAQDVFDVVKGAAPADAGCASTDPTAGGGTADLTGDVGTVVNWALSQVGKGYSQQARLGPNSYDCSGLITVAYSKVLGSIPTTQQKIGSTTADMPSKGQVVFKGDGSTKPDPASLKPGDLIFYYPSITHVGMYIGNGRIVHAANPRTGVTVAAYDSMPIIQVNRHFQ